MQKINQPTPPEVPLDLWRELYQAARAFQDLGPWDWMSDSQALGVSNEHGARLLCVLGANREVFGLVCYRGDAGCSAVLRLMQGTVAPDAPKALFSQDAILIDFVPRRELSKPDLAILKAIGYQPLPRRPLRYPEFRSHKPGFVPWFLDESEARMALDSLHKATAFGALMLKHPELFHHRQPTEKPFYPENDIGPLTPGKLTWHRMLPQPVPTDPVVDPQSLDLSGLDTLATRAGMAWELDSFFAHIRIGEGARPFYARLALAVDQASGYVLAFDSGGPEIPLARLAAQCLAKALRTAKCRPQVIQLQSQNLEQALKPVLATLKLKPQLVPVLPGLEMARESMERGMR